MVLCVSLTNGLRSHRLKIGARLHTMQQLKISDFKLETLSPHAFMNFKLLDEYGRQVEMSRNLTLLRQHFGVQAHIFDQRVEQSDLPRFALRIGPVHEVLRKVGQWHAMAADFLR